MHPMFRNWNPRNQAQVNNTLRLAMAECPEDMPELIKLVKSKGFDVPSGLAPATGWGSFESKRKNCSMQKKKESLAKKSEAIEGKYLLDPEKFEKDIREMIDSETQSILKGCDDEERRYYELALQLWDDSGYDYAGELYKKLQQQMYKYVSGTDYKMSGNFANIAWDWDRDHKDGISFYDLRKKLLDGVEDADTNEFSTWAIDWFFHAFGTYNMCYNYADELGEEAAILQKEDEDERENGGTDESKHKCSMSKKIESLRKRNEDYVPNVRERLWSLIDMELLRTADLGDYLLRSLSVDQLDKIYGWLKQDEMIPSDEELENVYQMQFDDKGNLVSIDTED